MALERKIKNKKIFFIDAETDGLYGEFISIGAVVTDKEGNELDQFYMADREMISKKTLQTWVLEHVIPYIGSCRLIRGQKLLLEEFWKFWLKYQKDVYCVADVPYPVEYRLFQKCVEVNVKEREFLAPYPLLDISSIMLARELDPLYERTELVENKGAVVHNALFDAKMSAELWQKLLAKPQNEK